MAGYLECIWRWFVWNYYKWCYSVDEFKIQRRDGHECNNAGTPRVSFPHLLKKNLHNTYITHMHTCAQYVYPIHGNILHPWRFVVHVAWRPVAVPSASIRRSVPQLSATPRSFHERRHSGAPCRACLWFPPLLLNLAEWCSAVRGGRCCGDFLL